MTKKIINYLSEFVSEHKIELFARIMEKRTKYLTVALEDIYQPHNASAVLRTADCFGIQDVHVIENSNPYQVNPDVALGSSNWISLKKHSELENNTLSAINKLKKEGYRIVATTPHTNDVNLEDFDLNKGKAAFFFGTELRGLSDLMLENADEFMKIPMHGFTESFNISVSASIILHNLTLRLHNSDLDWKLTDAERDNVHLNWLRAAIKDSKLIEAEFFKRELWK